MSSLVDTLFQDQGNDHPTHLYTAGIVLAALAFLVGIKVSLGKGHAL